MYDQNPGASTLETPTTQPLTNQSQNSAEIPLSVTIFRLAIVLYGISGILLPLTLLATAFNDTGSRTVTIGSLAIVATYYIALLGIFISSIFLSRSNPAIKRLRSLNFISGAIVISTMLLALVLFAVSSSPSGAIGLVLAALQVAMFLGIITFFLAVSALHSLGYTIITKFSREQLRKRLFIEILISFVAVPFSDFATDQTVKAGGSVLSSVANVFVLVLSPLILINCIRYFVTPKTPKTSAENIPTRSSLKKRIFVEAGISVAGLIIFAILNPEDKSNTEMSPQLSALVSLFALTFVGGLVLVIKDWIRLSKLKKDSSPIAN